MWTVAATDVLSVLRRGGKPSARELADFVDDYSKRMAESVELAVRTLCTTIDGSVVDEEVQSILKKVRIGLADGHAPVQKALQILAAGSMPNMLAIIRDPAHKARIATRDPLVKEPTFKAWYDDVFGHPLSLL